MKTAPVRVVLWRYSQSQCGTQICSCSITPSNDGCRHASSGTPAQKEHSLSTVKASNIGTPTVYFICTHECTTSNASTSRITTAALIEETPEKNHHTSSTYYTNNSHTHCPKPQYKVMDNYTQSTVSTSTERSFSVQLSMNLSKQYFHSHSQPKRAHILLHHPPIVAYPRQRRKYNRLRRGFYCSYMTDDVCNTVNTYKSYTPTNPRY